MLKMVHNYGFFFQSSCWYAHINTEAILDFLAGLKNIITFHLLYGDLTLIVGNLIVLRGISMSYLPAIPIF